MNISDHTAWIALSLVERIGKKTLLALAAHFDDDLQQVLASDVKALRRVPGIGAKIAAEIKAIDLKQVEQQIMHWHNRGLRIVPMDAPEYPQSLAQLDDAPPTLFVYGDKPLPQKAVAIVGTRQPSAAAIERAQALTEHWAKRGWAVVSGLALGIDAVAHHRVMTVPDGETFAVLGCGVWNVYPPANRELAERIAGYWGALLCEVQPEAGVNPAALVARNRIITGLSRAVFVIETEVNGGAMHAARFAKAQGRAIYTLDLPASGNQHLITEGARVIPQRLELLEF